MVVELPAAAGDPSTETVRSCTRLSLAPKGLRIASVVVERQAIARTGRSLSGAAEIGRAGVAHRTRPFLLWAIRLTRSTSPPGRRTTATNRDPSREITKLRTRVPLMPGTETECLVPFLIHETAALPAARSTTHRRSAKSHAGRSRLRAPVSTVSAGAPSVLLTGPTITDRPASATPAACSAVTLTATLRRPSWSLPRGPLTGASAAPVPDERRPSRSP